MSIRLSTKSIQRRISRVGIGAGALAVLLATALSAPAVAATNVPPTPDPTPPNQQSSPQYCVMVVGKAPSANTNSPTLWEHCSTKSPEDARASLIRLRPRPGSGPMCTQRPKTC